MDITREHRGSETIIGLRGRWVCGYDLRTELRAHVQRLVEEGCLHLVLDLGGVTFADSTVVGEIASTHIALLQRGGRLTLLNPSMRMFRLLSISRLVSVIDIRFEADMLDQAWEEVSPDLEAPVEVESPTEACGAMLAG